MWWNHAHAVAAVLAAASLLAPATPQSALSAFLPAIVDRAATGTQLGPTQSVPSPEACAARCLKLEQTEGQEVVSMNLCGDSATRLCQCSGWGVEYQLQENKTGCLWYRRSIPRNETRVEPRVAMLARVPDKGVALDSTSLLSKAFVANVEYLRLRADVDAMLYR